MRILSAMLHGFVVSVALWAATVASVVVHATPTGLGYTVSGCREFHAALDQDLDTASVNGPRTPTATFTRASTGSIYTRDGLVAGCASGDPCVLVPLLAPGNSQTLQTEKGAGIRLGPETVHLMLDSRNICSANWTSIGGPVCTADNQTGPDGSLTAERVQDDSAVSIEHREQTHVLSATDASHYVGQAWFKCPSAIPAQLTLSITGGTGVTTSNSFTCSTTTWERKTVELDNDNSVGNVNVTLAVKPHQGAGAEQGTIYVWGAQVYKAHDILQLDEETTGTTKTRPEDQLSYSQGLNGDLGTLCMWVYANDYAATSTLVEWNNVGAHMRFRLNASEQPELDTEKLGDDAQAISGTEVTFRTWDHVCWRWDQAAGDIDIFVNGVERALGTDDATWSAGGDYGTTMDFGAFTAGTEAIVAHVQLCDRFIGDAEVTRIYQKYRSSYE